MNSKRTAWYASFMLLGFMAPMFLGEAFGMDTIYLFQFRNGQGATSYDDAMAASSLQGIINREGPAVYGLTESSAKPQYWLDTFSKEGYWLSQKEHKKLAGLGDLRKLAGDRVKGIVIWDPSLPATVNVATTIAGVKDAVVLSPEQAKTLAPEWKLPIIEDLRNRFDGRESGSKKNDAYRWAIREYLAKGLCSKKLLCLFEDSASTREQGNIGYVITRDWAVKNRAFVFDLSPWGDEIPKDDPEQPLGTDLATYNMILEEMSRQTNGQNMTELSGFFSFWKYSNIPGFASKHEPVPTEWETVFLISPYNCYQNTVSSDCYNQSFHAHAPIRRLTQARPAPAGAIENKTYVCMFMADYDSTTPLYDFLPVKWDDPNRGKIPLTWGINPNLIETYPDIISHVYATATPNDHFASDASCAGYFNPSRIKPEYLQLFVDHNKRFFDMTDMTMAPMVLDWEAPRPGVKDAFAQFAPDGFATIVMDMHTNKGDPAKPHVWKGMPVTELINDICNHENAQKTAEGMYNAIKGRGIGQPGFALFRIVWVSPTAVIESLDELRKSHPEIPFEVVDAYTFFALLKKHYANAAP